MRRNVVIAILLATAGFVKDASAQSSSAFAGWVSMVTTPVGAFAPSLYVPPRPTSGHESGVFARYGHWQFAPDDDNTTNVGLGVAFAAGDGRLSFDLGRTTRKDCPHCDAYMIGGEFHLPLVVDHGGITVTLNPEVGFMTAADSDFSAVAAAISTPVSYAVAPGNGIGVVPFVSPGAGFGRVSGRGSSETGQRFVLGGGVALLDFQKRLQLTSGASKIFIENGATVFGIMLSYGR